MRKLFYTLILLVIISVQYSYSDIIYLPPGACMVVPTGSYICADSLYVDTNACFYGGDSSVICNSMVILGGGNIFISVTPVSTQIPVNFSLFQNYPNPFNPTTKIQFSVPSSQFVVIKVFDVTGREVTVLVNEELKPRTYEVDWDAGNFPSGIYYYKLETENYSETKKMVLLK